MSGKIRHGGSEEEAAYAHVWISNATYASYYKHAIKSNLAPLDPSLPRSIPTFNVQRRDAMPQETPLLPLASH